MPVVVVSARDIVAPNLCVCCGGPPDTALADAATRTWGKRVVHSQSRVAVFGICTRCDGHCRVLFPSWSNHLLWTCVVLFVAAVTHSFGVPVALLAVTWGVFVLGYLRARAELLRGRTTSCEAVDRPADYVRWYGTEHTFHFDSLRYARAFADANHAAKKRVLGLDPDGTPRLPELGPPSALGLWLADFRIPGWVRPVVFLLVMVAGGALLVWASTPGPTPIPPPPPDEPPVSRDIAPKADVPSAHAPDSVRPVHRSRHRVRK